MYIQVSRKTNSVNLRKLMLLTLAIITVSFAFIPTSDAGYRYYRAPALSDALGINGFATLKFALDTTELTQVLDSNRVTVFAPTDDVFESTAKALGCTDALDLATRLLGIPVGESNALAVVLTHHAVLGKIGSKYSLLKKSPIHTVSGDEVTTGVNSNGLYVQGAANATPATITDDGFKSYRWAIYPINGILLPFAPPANLCE